MNEAFLLGILSYFDSILMTIKTLVANGGEADEQVKKGCAVFLVYEDDFAALAAKSVSKYDDTFIAEIGEAVRKILPPAVVSAIEGMKVPA